MGNNTAMTVNELSQISKIVRFHREQAKLTQPALARLSGVGKTVIFDIEHGKTTVRLTTLMRVFAALNIAVSISSPLMERFAREEADDATS